MLRKFILLLVVQCVIVFEYCQKDNIIYQCDFESSSQHEGWELNAGNQGKQCVNQWNIGAAGSNGGDYGLFVSNDGKTNNYTANKK